MDGLAEQGLYRAADLGNKALERLEMAKRAQDDLLTFARFTSPDFEDVQDVSRSRYIVKPHHRYLASMLMAVEMGILTRVIISWPPRHGKTELATRKFLPWTLGRNPRQSIIFGTYNEEFALDHGRDIRATMQAQQFRQVFPDFKLAHHSRASDRLATTDGGTIFFVGRGGSITGRGAHKLVLDDPIKDRDEADSRVTRNRMWGWFTDVAMSRLMDSAGAVIIILTRWHEDDLVGRLTDPKNPFYDEELAKQWTVINIPALADEDDPLGRNPGDPLWPERFTGAYLRDMRRLNPESFSAIWQGRPSPEEGAFFTRACIVPYNREELPSNLRLYGASDHATTNIERNDKSCFGLAGVDPNGDIWILPELFWRRSNTQGVVEGMLHLFKRGPIIWWAERDAIFRSIEPFLRQRMVETGTYCAIHQLSSTKDKVARAQPIHARMSMGKVHLPRFAPWYQDALHELMAFPNSLRDDFVDFLSILGRGLALQVPASPKRRGEVGPSYGTLGYLKKTTKDRERRERAANFQGF